MECGCSHKGKKSTSHNPEKSFVWSDVDAPLSKQKIIEGDKFTLLMLAYCLDRKSFVKAFSPFLKNATFNKENIQKLAALWKTGNGKKMGLDMDSIFGSINVNLRRLEACEIKWAE